MRVLTLVLLCVAFFVTGCATRKEIADQAEKGSLATEDASNRLLLLNVVRAYHRNPMYFVRFTGLRGPIGVGAPTVTLPTPFGPDFTSQIYSLSTTIKFDQAVFELQLQDTQEFYRGMTTPVKPEVLQYFLEQGWPQQMILWLFVREIETTDASGTRTSYISAPQSETAFSKFREVLERLQGCDVTLHEDKPVSVYGPPLDIAESTSPEKLAALKTAGVELQKVQLATGVRYQVQQTRKVAQLKLVPSDPATAAPGACLLTGNAATFKGEAGSDKDGAKTVFTLRSVEAMIYFIGELSRRQLDGTLRGTMPGVYCLRYEASRQPSGAMTDEARARDAETQKDCEQRPGSTAVRQAPLFVMERDATADALVKVDYNGATYSIPKGPRGGRSMHVMSLLTQLIALQNKGADLPVTQNVRVVNQ